jgi:retron-type reverse transcriptase
MVILKLDFEKAFDKIEHKVILYILKHKGFGTKWFLWISMIMNFVSSSILLNGVSGKAFRCKRGVRQGHPLSPILLVLAADLFQSILNKAKDMGLLRLLLSEHYGQDFSIIQYADDTILIMEACPKQLFFKNQCSTRLQCQQGFMSITKNQIYIQSIYC